MRLITGFLAMLFACGGPHLEHKTVVEQTYTASERCGQHLIETSFIATGYKWGEAITLRSCGPNEIAGVLEISIEDGVTWGSRFGDAPESTRCSAGPAAVSGTGSGGRAKASESTSVSEADVSGGQTASLRQISGTKATRDACFASSSLALHLGKLEKGRKIGVRVWSKEPSDLEAALLWLRHVELHPSVSDEEWRAHLKREKSEWRDVDDDYGPLATSGPKAPPPARVAEERPERPDVRAAWTPGYWHWREAQTPKAAGEWVWMPGLWRLDTSPPPPRLEHRPDAPGRGAIWIVGHWQLSRSGFIWVAGRWRR